MKRFFLVITLLFLCFWPEQANADSIRDKEQNLTDRMVYWIEYGGWDTAYITSARKLVDGWASLLANNDGYFFETDRVGLWDEHSTWNDELWIWSEVWGEWIYLDDPHIRSPESGSAWYAYITDAVTREGKMVMNNGIIELEDGATLNMVDGGAGGDTGLDITRDSIVRLGGNTLADGSRQSTSMYVWGRTVIHDGSLLIDADCSYYAADGDIHVGLSMMQPSNDREFLGFFSAAVGENALLRTTQNLNIQSPIRITSEFAPTEYELIQASLGAIDGRIEVGKDLNIGGEFPDYLSDMWAIRDEDKGGTHLGYLVLDGASDGIGSRLEVNKDINITGAMKVWRKSEARGKVVRIGAFAEEDNLYPELQSWVDVQYDSKLYADHLYVGDVRPGKLFVSHGGVVGADLNDPTRYSGNITLGNKPGVNGVMDLWGRYLIDTEGVVTVGSEGIGLVDARDPNNMGISSLRTGTVYLARYEGSEGTVILADDSKWTSTGSFYIGGSEYDAGGIGQLQFEPYANSNPGAQLDVAGKLKIYAGSSMTGAVKSIQTGSVDVYGTYENEINSIRVRGSYSGNSKWTVSNDFKVKNGGNVSIEFLPIDIGGDLRLENGVENGGATFTTNNSVSITGALNLGYSSQFTVDSLTSKGIAIEAEANLNILSSLTTGKITAGPTRPGGRITVKRNDAGDRAEASTGSVVVENLDVSLTNSDWTNNSDFSVRSLNMLHISTLKTQSISLSCYLSPIRINSKISSNSEIQADDFTLDRTSLTSEGRLSIKSNAHILSSDAGLLLIDAGKPTLLGIEQLDDGSVINQLTLKNAGGIVAQGWLAKLYTRTYEGKIGSSVKLSDYAQWINYGDAILGGTVEIVGAGASSQGEPTYWDIGGLLKLSSQRLDQPSVLQITEGGLVRCNQLSSSSYSTIAVRHKKSLMEVVGQEGILLSGRLRIATGGRMEVQGPATVQSLGVNRATVIIGDNAASSTSDQPTLELKQGLTVGSYPAPSPVDVWVRSDGLLDVYGSLTLNEEAILTAEGMVNVGRAYSGDLQPGTVRIANNGVLDMNGGAVHADTQIVVDSGGRLAMGNGSLVSPKLTFASGATLCVDHDAALGTLFADEFPDITQITANAATLEVINGAAVTGNTDIETLVLKDGSSLTAGGQYHISGPYVDTLRIEDGRGSFYKLWIGRDGHDGRVAVVGPDASVTTSGYTGVGMSFGSHGAVLVSNGGQFTGHDIGAGWSAGGTGDIDVSGVGSALITPANEDLIIGREGAGTLSIEAGGSVLAGRSAHIGQRTGSHGAVTIGSVTPETSTMTVEGNMSVVGYYDRGNGGSTALVNVNAGGLLDVHGSLAVWEGGQVLINQLGQMNVGDTLVMMEGSGLSIASGMTNIGVAYDGDLQPGTVRIANNGVLDMNGGAVRADTQIVVDSGGRLAMGNGSLVSPKLTFASGATLRVDHDAALGTLFADEFPDITQITANAATLEVINGAAVTGNTDIETLVLKDGSSLTAGGQYH
ncbi:MAG: hypothetical protein QGG42_05320, partial [Phycisphaerae bacterium]|nr:hypothetical protein [Phycisphaerae bacterium]